MTNSTPDIPILDDDAVGEIEAQLQASGPGGDLTIERMKLMTAFEAGQREYVRALCQTVRVLRASIIAMQSGFDTYAQRVGIEKAKLQSQLEQVTKEHDALRAENKRVLNVLDMLRRGTKHDACWCTGGWRNPPQHSPACKATSRVYDGLAKVRADELEQLK